MVAAGPAPALREGPTATARWTLITHRPRRGARGYACCGSGLVLEREQRPCDEVRQGALAGGGAAA